MEETNLSSMENNPSWLLPLLTSRATGALLALREETLAIVRDAATMNRLAESDPSWPAESMSRLRNWPRR
jgi:hypothetical protein